MALKRQARLRAHRPVAATAEPGGVLDLGGRYNLDVRFTQGGWLHRSTDGQLPG